MYVYHTNTHTGRTFRYDHDEFDMFTPMFDRTLHNNSTMIDTRWCYPYTCAYCDASFPSRNRLFFHLGFMDIDTRPVQRDVGATIHEIDRTRKKFLSIVTKVKNRKNCKKQRSNTATKLTNLLEELRIR